MHPNPYIVGSSGYKRYFCQYPGEIQYYPYTPSTYDIAEEREKYYRSWSEWPSMPNHVIIEPHEHDVLMGRGGRNNQHSGNDILRQFGRLQGENYRVATKKGKSELSRLLVRQMRELDPPARFLKRVHQTAAWEEVSEETAREKASQVLRDAVSGLLGDVPEEDISPFQHLPTISAPVSVDEHEHSPRINKRRHQSQEFHSSPPTGTRIESDGTRRRYRPADSTDHSRNVPSTSSSQRRHNMVGCSPIRRQAEESYNLERHHVRSIRQSTGYRSSEIQSSTSQQLNHHSNLGNLDEVALLRGDLLESDGEEDSSVFRETQRRRL